MVVRTDSDAARSMLHRAGCGRARHLATRCLWHQDAFKDGLFEGKRCASKENPADVGKETMERLLEVLCIVSRAATGFASTWPGLVSKARERDAGQC